MAKNHTSSKIIHSWIYLKTLVDKFPLILLEVQIIQ